MVRFTCPNLSLARLTRRKGQDMTKKQSDKESKIYIHCQFCTCKNNIEFFTRFLHSIDFYADDFSIEEDEDSIEEQLKETKESLIDDEKNKIRIFQKAKTTYAKDKDKALRLQQEINSIQKKLRSGWPDKKTVYDELLSSLDDSYFGDRMLEAIDFVREAYGHKQMFNDESMPEVSKICLDALGIIEDIVIKLMDIYTDYLACLRYSLFYSLTEEQIAWHEKHYYIDSLYGMWADCGEHLTLDGDWIKESKGIYNKAVREYYNIDESHSPHWIPRDRIESGKNITLEDKEYAISCITNFTQWLRDSGHIQQLQLLKVKLRTTLKIYSDPKKYAEAMKKAEEIRKLTVAEEQAYNGYEQACQFAEKKKLLDKEAYDIIKKVIEESGENQALPKFNTWRRTLGRARSRLGMLKNQRRLGANSRLPVVGKNCDYDEVKRISSMLPDYKNK
jgi:hypothetical protein